MKGYIAEKTNFMKYLDKLLNSYSKLTAKYFMKFVISAIYPFIIC
jgi:hypothetical protein